MMAKFKRPGRALLALAGLAVGIALAAILVSNAKAPVHGLTAPQVPVLTVIELQPLPFRLEARGHGVARPAEIWQAIASVPGRVVAKHPGLESGTLLEQGTPLLELDPSRYHLAIAAAEAELARLAAEQDGLATEADNTRRLARLERQRLELAEQELARIEHLAAIGDVSDSRRDEQRRAALAQRQAVASLENQSRLIPSRRQHLEALLEQAATRLAQARQDLQDTRFVAPYDLRLGEVEVELHQHVAAGQRLFQADGIAATEVEARVPLTVLRRLMSAVAYAEPGEEALDLGERLDFSAIRAEVILAGDEDVRWPARVTRVAGGLDPATRAARVVVVVDEPYRVSPPVQMPLQRGMYVRVRLSAESPEPLLALPVSAVHNGEVYSVDRQDRLRRRPVELAFEQNDLAVIRSGLAAGERVIVDDPVPALEEMAVEPYRDRRLEQQLRRRAAGLTP